MSGVGDVVRFSTQGGPGSVYADLDGIDAAAERFREAADVTRVLVFHAEHAASLVDRAASGPGAAARLREALREGARRLQGLTDALARNREDLRRAAEAYRRAEQGAAGVMDAEDPRAAVLGAALEARAADGLSVEEAEFLVRAGTEVVGEALLAQLLGLPVGTAVDGGIAAIGGFGGPVRDWVAGQCAVGELGGELEWAADRLGDIDPSPACASRPRPRGGSSPRSTRSWTPRTPIPSRSPGSLWTTSRRPGVSPATCPRSRTSSRGTATARAR